MIMWFVGGFISDISFLGTVLYLFDNFFSSTFPLHSSPFTLSTVPTQWIWSFDWRSPSNFLISPFLLLLLLLPHPFIFFLAPYLLYFWEMFATLSLSFLFWLFEISSYMSTM